MKEMLINRLKSLGYTYVTEDEWLLEFCTEKIENRIKREINDASIPKQLLEIEVDMICGEFLKAKKGTGQLTTYDFKQITQTVKAGDTQVTFFEGSSPEQQFDSLISTMINGHTADFIRFRKLVW